MQLGARTRRADADTLALTYRNDRRDTLIGPVATANIEFVAIGIVVAEIPVGRRCCIKHLERGLVSRYANRSVAGRRESVGNIQLSNRIGGTNADVARIGVVNIQAACRPHAACSKRCPCARVVFVFHNADIVSNAVTCEAAARAEIEVAARAVQNECAVDERGAVGLEGKYRQCGLPDTQIASFVLSARADVDGCGNIAARGRGYRTRPSARHTNARTEGNKKNERDRKKTPQLHVGSIPRYHSLKRSIMRLLWIRQS